MDEGRSRAVTIGTSPIFDESADRLMTGAKMTPCASPPDEVEAIESPDESRDEEDSRSWRGVFAVEYPDEVLFTKRIDIRPDRLDEWSREPVTGHGHSEHDE